MISRSSFFAGGLLVTTALASPAFAQTAPNPPQFLTVDKNGVDLANGGLTFAMTEGSIGPVGDPITMDRYWTPVGWTDNWSGTLAQVSSTVIYITFGRTSDKFNWVSGTWVSSKADGSTLTVNAAGDTYTYTAGDGTVITYSLSYDNLMIHTMTVFGANGCQSTNATLCALPTHIVRPNGRTIDLTWNVTVICTDPAECSTAKMKFRLADVVDSRGYGFSIAYADNSGSVPAVAGWYRRTTLTFSNSKVSLPNPPTVTYAYPSNSIVEVTDPGGRTWRLTQGAGGLVGIRRPGSASDNITGVTSGTILTLTADGVTTTYNRTVSGTAATTTITDALTKQEVAIADTSLGRVTSFKNELNRTTSYQYDANARLTRVTQPEGNYTQYTYDGRGNVTQQRNVAKAGSGLADIVASAAFPANCTNPKTCNQPTSTTDPRGSVTDYTYDATHGGLLTQTDPAPSVGAVRPQTRYTYTLQNSEYLLTGVSACQTLPSCAGGADETKAALVYDPLNNNLTTITGGDGTGTLAATATGTYDAVGNLLTIDGPLTGTADTSRLRYDAARQLIGLIGPDPDGAGILKNRALRLTYRPDGQASKQELGTTNGQSDPDWANFVAAQAVDITFDSNSRPMKQTLSAGGTTYVLTHQSYDALGRPDCTAVRMDPAQWNAQTNNCTPQTSGPNGPDRIRQTVYDDASEAIQLKVAVGTTDAATERTLTYTSNGLLQTLKDAENNLTTYVYDGFDRLSQTLFPNNAKGSGTSNAADYEQLTYDANSNITNRRLRDTTSIAFTFDKLDRVTLKDLPGTDPDVTIGYDNLGRVTSMSQPGYSESFGYDALSRQTAENQGFGNITRQFDLAGRMIRTTWWDGFFVDYDRLVTGEISKVRENGATSGVGVLASYGYDDLGRRTSETLGNGASQAFTYDPVSRLASLTNDLPGTSNDLSATFSYNPASQIASTTRTGDTYAFTGLANENRTTSSNGLNQQVTIGGAAATWDSRGNLTTDPTTSKTYTYWSSDMLKSAGGGVTLYYDPLLRLTEYDTGVSTRFVHDGMQVAAEVDNPAGAIQKRYVWGDAPDELIVQYNGSGTSSRNFAGADERGSIVSLTDSAGALVVINRYDEFGRPQSGNAGRFQYTGQGWLPEAGVYNYKARNYLPQLGIFAQTDPIGYADSPNLYAYVLDDPVNLVDPLGLSGCDGTDPTVDCRTFSVEGRRSGSSLPQRVHILVIGGGGCIGDCRPIVVQARAPTGKTQFYFNGKAWVLDPLYSDKCGSAVLKKSAVPIVADTLSLVPGLSAAPAMTRFGASSVSGIWSAMHGDPVGAGLGVAGAQVEAVGPTAEQSITGRPSNVGRLIPLIGKTIGAYSLARDLWNAGSEFLNCSGGR